MTQTRRSGRFLRMATAGSVAAMVLLALQYSPGARADDKIKCLWVNRIDHTEILNDHQILFYETNKKVWLSNLPAPCPTLSPVYGFAWRSSIDEICGNVEQIRVLRTGVSCQLGAFVPYVKGEANKTAASSGK